MLPKVDYFLLFTSGRARFRYRNFFGTRFSRCSGETSKKLEALLWTNFQFCFTKVPLTFWGSRRKIMSLCK